MLRCTRWKWTVESTRTEVTQKWMRKRVTMRILRPRTVSELSLQITERTLKINILGNERSVVMENNRCYR